MEDLVQGTDAWKRARCGSLGASQVADAIARTKTGYGASRANLMAQLLVERLTEVPTEGFVTDAMRWGVEKEPDARAAYEFRTDASVVQIGLIRHPAIIGTHASPDGLIGEDGLIEIKAPNTATHIETLLTGTIPEKYITQMYWQMACTGRNWADYVSFDPRLPEAMSLFIKRVPRNDGRIADLEAEVGKFISELDAKVAALKEKFCALEAA